MKTFKLIFTALFSLIALSCSSDKIVLTTNESASFKKVQDVTTEYQDAIDKLQAKDPKTAIWFNNNMLNILFADEVSKFFDGAEDLSLQKFYASLDADDASVAFGFNFDGRKGKELNKLTNLYTLGFKAKAEEKFATILNNGKLSNDDLGLTFKYTHVFRGSINFKGISKAQITSYRQLLLNKFDEQIAAYKEGLQFTRDSLKVVSPPPAYDKAFDDLMEEKKEEFYGKIAKDEIKYIKDNKLYNFVSDKWISFDAFVPITEKEYIALGAAPDYTRSDEKFYPIKVSGSFNYFRKYAKGVSCFVSVLGTLKNYNNILSSDAAAVTYETFSIQNPGQQSISAGESAYQIIYDKFITPSVSSEIVFFPFKNPFGISPALEKNFGTYDALNWKIGIPISLTDKDGTQSVNFELQWKELNKMHLVGISVNFLFGKYVK